MTRSWPEPSTASACNWSAPPLAAAICGSSFTVDDLRHVYEAVWNTQLDPHRFSRIVLRRPGFIEPAATAGARDDSSAPLYRAGPAALLSPPVQRSKITAVPPR